MSETIKGYSKPTVGAGMSKEIGETVKANPSEMTLDSILAASDEKYKTMEPKFTATVVVASGAEGIEYEFLDQINFDFVVRRVAERRDGGQIDLLDNDSIVSVRVDNLKKPEKKAQKKDVDQ